MARIILIKDTPDGVKVLTNEDMPDFQGIAGSESRVFDTFQQAVDIAAELESEDMSIIVLDLDDLTAFLL